MCACLRNTQSTTLTGSTSNGQCNCANVPSAAVSRLTACREAGDGAVDGADDGDGAAAHVIRLATQCLASACFSCRLPLLALCWGGLASASASASAAALAAAALSVALMAAVAGMQLAGQGAIRQDYPARVPAVGLACNTLRIHSLQMRSVCLYSVCL